MKTRGFVIILVLAFLLLLTLLVITYITLALTDRNVTRNYLDNKRAHLIAQSGLDYASARLQDDLLDLSWQYKDDLNPSFVSGTVTINGKTTGYSQIAGNTYDKDIFILKIKDNQGSINVNDGLANERISVNLARILNNLVRQDTVIGPASPDIGFALVTGRPSRGYSNLSEPRRVLIDSYGAIGEDYFKKIEPFVTLHAWQDPNVANPVPLSGAVLDLYPVKYNQDIGVYRYGRGKAEDGHVIGTAPGESAWAQLKFASEGVTDSKLLEHAIYGLDELNPQWIEIVLRGPVNVNTASKEVLIALIKDLKGLFVVERKRNDLMGGGIGFNHAYSMRRDSHDYAPNVISNPNSISMAFDNVADLSDDADPLKAPVGDELGFIYSTSDIDAARVADEILKCRAKESDYITAWFGGPFKNWRQFNAFCDYLLTKTDPDDPAKKILEDTRDIFHEYKAYMTFFYETISSRIARQYASQAIADTLKANFNPNLHLNELNPDANISTLVDKTDLIVNSTEFCFLPTGYFDIESESFILRQDIPIAQGRYKATVKLYDAYRETNQSQFLEGQITNSATNANNGKTLEIGPEPGITISRENNRGGYIALSTLNGPDSGTSDTTTTVTTYELKGNKTLTYTESKTTYGWRLYSHFGTNFNADFHFDYLTDPTAKDNITLEFLADPTESTPGPYDHNSKNRLARSYKEGDTTNPVNYAPADLRIDGAYIERHTGIAYKSSNNILTQRGVISYWIKPWFHPEMTGRHRVYFSASKDKIFGSTRKHHVFANWFVAGHLNDPFDIANEDSSLTNYTVQYRIRPLSLLFGSSTINTEGTGTENGGAGLLSPTLNHLGHYGLDCYPTEPTRKTNYIKAGQWFHVVMRYDLASGTVEQRIYLNGNSIANTAAVPDHSELLQLDYFTDARIKIGHPTQKAGTETREMNWTCDATVDEFYIAAALTYVTSQSVTTDRDGNIIDSSTSTGTGDSTTQAEDMAKNIWRAGRYYKPSGQESYFISGNLSSILRSKNFPDASTIPAPDGVTGSTGTQVNQSNIIGISWTWFAEGTDAAGRAILKDYKNFAAADANDPATYIYPQVGVKIGTNDYTDDAYSVVNRELNPGAPIQYEVTIELPQIAPDAVLLYSPVFDDITIYYTKGTEFLSYSYFD